MIKEKDILPGRVLVQEQVTWDLTAVCPERKTILEAWLVICFRPKVKRRHAKSQAPKEGWELLALSFKGQLRTFNIMERDLRSWKRLF